MGKSPMSTLSSTIRKSHFHNHHHHHKYLHQVRKGQLSPDSVENIQVVETAGDTEHICGAGRRQHRRLDYKDQPMSVAIATQVISPSAIGGSLKFSGRRRLCQRYDLEGDYEDEDQGLFQGRKRIPWGKLTCYGVSIGILVLLMTGVVLAVGYMQSEKQRILAQSQRLSQDFRSQSNLTVTTWRPKIIWENVTSSPIEEILSATEDIVAATSKEIDFDEDTDEDEEESNATTSKEIDFDDGTADEEAEEEDSHDEESKELEIYELPEQLSRKSESARVDEAEPLSLTVLTRSPLHATEEYNENGAEHRSPSEVKVLPPQDFFTKGLSIGIPTETESKSQEQNETFSFIKSINPNSISFQILPSTGFPLDLNLSRAEPDHTGSAEVNLILPSQKFYSEEGAADNGKDFVPKLQSLDNSLPELQSSEDKSSRTFPGDSSPKIFSAKVSSPTFLAKDDYPPKLISLEESSPDLLSKISATEDSAPRLLSFDESSPHVSSAEESSPKIFSAQKTSPKIFSEDKPSSSIFSEDKPSPKLFSEEKSSPKTFLKENLSPNIFKEEPPSPKIFSEADSPPELISLEESSPKIYAVGAENSVKNELPTPSFQTDLFHAEDLDSSGEVPERDDGTDSTMSASTKSRGSTKTPSTLIIASDNMYTPRPGTSPFYPDRPRHPSKTSVDFPMREFSSNQSEVRVKPPETTPKPDFGSLTSPTESSSNSKLTFNFNFTPDAVALKDLPFKPSKPDSKNQSGQNKFQQEHTTRAPPSAPEYQIAAPKTTPVTPAPFFTPATTTFHFDFHQLTTPAPSLNSRYDFQPNSIPDVLSKRTYNFDFNPHASASTNTNPFAHLLNSGVTSNIGSPTSTGANLGYQNSFNFDTNYNAGANSYSSPHLNLPSGTIPLDLAGSYIQAGAPAPAHTHAPYRGTPAQVHKQQISDLTDFGFQYNPAPQLDIASIVQNSATSAASNHFPSIITTPGNPNPPEYNTITQGIHLLSLLHGNIPAHYSDSQGSESAPRAVHYSHPPAQATPEYHTNTAVTGYAGSSAPYLHQLSSNQNPSYAQAPAQAQNSYYQGAAPDSFSQSIATKTADFSNVFKNPDSTSALRSAEAQDEREISSILKIPQTNAPREGKALDMEASSSDFHPVLPKIIPTEKPIINFSKLLSKGRKGYKRKEESQERTEKGLKSGFYI